jgi:Protein of unknown function (DUF1524)/Domain of unknown function (DUF5655)
VKDIYNLRIRKYLLGKLENHDQKALVNIDKCTIEHIMPQNEHLSVAWQVELGPSWQDIQARYLHTIGNLTLTHHNSELGDRPFTVKCDLMKGGFAVSPIRLSRSLSTVEHWNNELPLGIGGDAAHPIPTSKAMPGIILDPPNGEDVDSSNGYNLDSYLYLQGATRSLFDQLRQRILSLDESVREEFKKLYIVYKTTTNFVDVVPQAKQLR